MPTKYIAFDRGDLPPQVIVFGELLQHSEVAYDMRVRLGEPVSAGFVGFSNGSPYAYGDSFSLKLGSRPDEDTRLLKQVFNRQ